METSKESELTAAAKPPYEPLRIKLTKVQPPKKIPSTAKFNGVGLSHFADLHETQLLLPISLNNPKCTGDELALAILEATAKYGTITVVICDELFWYNLRQYDDQDDEITLKKQATQMGSDFIINNLYALYSPIHHNTDKTFDEFKNQYPASNASELLLGINQLSQECAGELNCRFEILRWADWIQRGDYAFYSRRDAAIKHIHTDPTIKASLEKCAREYAASQISKGEKYSNAELLRRRACDYYPEEIFELTLLAAYLGYNFLAYPAKNPPEVFRKCWEYFIRADDTNTVNSDTPNECFLIENTTYVNNWLEIRYTYTTVKPESTRKRATSNTQEIEDGIPQFAAIPSAKIQELFDLTRNFIESCGDDK